MADYAEEEEEVGEVQVARVISASFSSPLQLLSASFAEILLGELPYKTSAKNGGDQKMTQICGQTVPKHCGLEIAG